MDYAEAKRITLEMIHRECVERAKLYVSFTPDNKEPEDIRQNRAELCLRTLKEWSEDPVLFINQACWAPDPKGHFGGKGHLPTSLAPPRMVPIILYPGTSCPVPPASVALHDLRNALGLDLELSVHR